MDQPNADAVRVLGQWGIAPLSLEPIHAGHINRTFRVDSARGRFALQWLNPIFDPAIHHDIEAITRQLTRAGMTTPLLVPAGERLWVTDEQGGVWRLMTWIDGHMLLRADSAGRCGEAARLLGTFHRALWRSDHVFCARRLGVHDTAQHIQALRLALESHRHHRAFARVQPVAAGILALAEGLVLPDGVPERVVHGDPKISNVLFDDAGQAIALIDLDTLSRMPITVELGDALRSWCQPGGEESQTPLELEFFAASVHGWAQAVGTAPTGAERDGIAPAVLTIAVELAARFCRDALEERYFGWDGTRFAAACEHNLARAQSQLYLARSVRQALPQMHGLVQDAFGSTRA